MVSRARKFTWFMQEFYPRTLKQGVDHGAITKTQCTD
jgi:hypothetical protein